MNDALKSRVFNRGCPPDSFLEELILWGSTAPEEIFAPNSSASDIYSDIRPVLGPWESPLHRRAAMLEVMRVHAGFESSWNWDEGVDVTNRTSVTHRDGEETGIFQVSFDSTWLHGGAMLPFATENGVGMVDTFITKMKSDHKLALEYYARLIRVSIKWAGPLINHKIDPWLSREAVKEFELALSS